MGCWRGWSRRRRARREQKGGGGATGLGSPMIADFEGKEFGN